MNKTSKILKIPTRDFPFSIKQLNDDLGEFEGFASTWDVDLVKDRVAQGAFARTLREAKADMERLGGKFLWVVCWMHDVFQPIGAIFDAVETNEGLFVRGFLDLDSELGRRAYSALKKQYISSFSIGYKPVRHHMEAAKGVPGGIRVLDEIQLVEVSIVSFPANPQARVTGVKTAQEAWTEAMINDMKHTTAKLGAGKEKHTMGRTRYIDEDDYYERPAFSGSRVTNEMSDFQRAWYGGKEPPTYAVERGLEEEDPIAFERAWRAELREEDDIWLLTDKNRIKELERREQERQDKQKKQHEALLAERQETAERQRAWDRETFTPEDYSRLTGIDVNWCRGIFQQYIANGLVTAIDEATLTLNRSAVQLIGRRSAEDIEYQVLKVRSKWLARERAA